jgi:chemotaxis-related protein WspB
MLFVLFHLGRERYALDASHVIEVVPLLALKRFPQSPRGVAGVFIYRGHPVPALDLCELTVGRPATEHLSTRIIIVKHQETPAPDQLIGLIAERVTDTIRREPGEFVDAGVKLATVPFLGPMLKDERGMIQLIATQKLLQTSLSGLLTAPTREESHATD